MGTIKCLIVDDEAPARRVLETYLEKLDGAELAGMAKDAVEAYNLLQKEKVDLVFLDINMPEISGIALLGMLHSPPIVILTTAYAEYGVESYEYNVADYLLKPIRFERFLKAFDKAKLMLLQSTVTESNLSQNHFEFKAGREWIKIPVSEILYLQSLGNYLKIFTPGKTYLSLLPTKEAEMLLSKGPFIRLHKSVIVNLAFVSDYNADSVTVNNTVLAIGKTYRKYVDEKLKQWKNGAIQGQKSVP